MAPRWTDEMLDKMAEENAHAFRELREAIVASKPKFLPIPKRFMNCGRGRRWWCKLSCNNRPTSRNYARIPAGFWMPWSTPHPWTDIA